MMFTKSSITVDPGVAENVITLFRQLDRGRGGPYGTWHGQRMKKNPYPWFQSAFDLVSNAIGSKRIDQWWFNCGQKGDVYRWHSHSPYLHSAVLYIQVPENSGGIEFRKQEEYQLFQPSVGDFIEFSGNLTHRVLENCSNDYRISAAFNLK